MLLLLLLTGMETDLKLVQGEQPRLDLRLGRRHRRAVRLRLRARRIPARRDAARIPSKRLITSLFLGTALSISSVKIVATVVREMNFLRRTVGQVILASAIIDDTIGWIIIAVIFGLALHGHVDPLSVAKSVIGTLAFLAFSLTVGRRLVFAGDPLGQRHLRQRVRRDHRDPGDHGR